MLQICFLILGNRMNCKKPRLNRFRVVFRSPCIFSGQPRFALQRLYGPVLPSIGISDRYVGSLGGSCAKALLSYQRGVKKKKRGRQFRKLEHARLSAVLN